MSSSCRPIVRKKAALCMLRLYRKNPDVVNTDGWPECMAHLLNERDLGVLIAVMSLLVALVANTPEAYWNCVPKCVQILERLTRGQDVPQDYTYYGIPSPWLQVKTMRVLQYFPSIEDPSIRKSLLNVLQTILLRTDVVKNINKNNASHAVLFEALSLVMHLDAEKDLMSQCIVLLGKFVCVREPNIRYLGLENMTRMLLVADVVDTIRKYQAQIIASLKDPDNSIRRRSLDLLYAMCDVSNAKNIVEELLQYLTTADFGIREELALKAAILSEKFAPDLSWYVDAVLRLIDKAGDFVSDDIWYRVVQVVTNNDDLQAYAAEKARNYLDKPAVHETMVKVSGYLLGEYSHLLARRPGCSSKEIFHIIKEKISAVTTVTKAILLSACVKVLMHCQPPNQELFEQATATFRRYENSVDAEVQQRAVEFLALSRNGLAMVDIMAEMPKFPERQSALLKKAVDTDGDAPEVSATKLRLQQQNSMALVVADRRPPNGDLHLLSVTEAGASNQYPKHAAVAESQASEVPHSSQSQVHSNGATQQHASGTPHGDLLGDLIGTLAIDAPPAEPTTGPSDSQALEAPPKSPAISAASADSLALVVLDAAPTQVQPLKSVSEWFRELSVKDSGVLYEDPYVQIGLKAEWRNAQGRMVLFFGNKFTAPLRNVRGSVLSPPHIRTRSAVVPETIPPRAQVQVPVDVACIGASRETAVLDFSYNVEYTPVKVQLKLPTLLNKFLQIAPVSANEFVAWWRALGGPPSKIQEVVRGVRPMPLTDMADLFIRLHVGVLPGLDPNVNNIVAATTFYSGTAATLCLVRVETDPLDRTQMRLTVASEVPNTTYELKELMKEQLVDIPSLAQPSRTSASSLAAMGLTAPAAALAGLI